MEMTIRPMTKAEKMYCYTQSQQIRSQCGNIGYLRADMDTDGQGFYSTWNGFRDDLKTPEFQDEFNQLINTLRFQGTLDAFLTNRTAMLHYCFAHMDARINDREFGFRVDTAGYAYMMRLNPNRGEYNLYCYCYRKDWLDHHLQEAERGIRFIDSSYNELFRIPDGGRIRITYPDGDRREEACRYIDPYHVEVGFDSMNLFHICEFAERMEESGAKIEPVEVPAKNPREKGAAR